jgi:hypothetical protein
VASTDAPAFLVFEDTQRSWRSDIEDILPRPPGRIKSVPPASTLNGREASACSASSTLAGRDRPNDSHLL